MVNIGNDWDEILYDEFRGENYLKIREFLKKEYFSRVVYPPMDKIFTAFKLTPYKDVKAGYRRTRPLPRIRTGARLLLFGRGRR